MKGSAQCDKNQGDARRDKLKRPVTACSINKSGYEQGREMVTQFNTTDSKLIKSPHNYLAFK
jgi:hypothetical protein